MCCRRTCRTCWEPSTCAFTCIGIVEALDVSGLEQAYGAEGRLAYPPRMMLKVRLYAFALGVTSTRRLEQRIREDLPLRYLAGCLQPDHKTLSEFLRRHRAAINDVFTQVLEIARGAGMGKLGHVAIDSSRHPGQRLAPQDGGGGAGGARSASAGPADSAALPAEGERAGRGRGSGRELELRAAGRSWRSNVPVQAKVYGDCPKRGRGRFPRPIRTAGFCARARAGC